MPKGVVPLVVAAATASPAAGAASSAKAVKGAAKGSAAKVRAERAAAELVCSCDGATFFCWEEELLLGWERRGPAVVKVCVIERYFCFRGNLLIRVSWIAGALTCKQ